MVDYRNPTTLHAITILLILIHMKYNTVIMHSIINYFEQLQHVNSK